MIPVVISFILRLYLFTNVYQQSFYEFRNVLKFFYKNIFILSVSFFIFLFNYFLNSWILIVLGYIFVSFECFYFLSNIIKPLKITKRVIRMWIGVFILCLPFIVLKMFFLCLTLVPFFIYISNFINKPIEYFKNHKYLNRAKNKYDLSNGIKIAVTGSYGKTSVKNYLSEVLKNQYLVISSPKSYNTPLGLSKFINNNNLDMMEYIILEFGARRVKDIQELGKLYLVDIAVITEIGLMHIDTFKTQKNIINEKMSLLNYLKSDGFAILNYENEYIRNYPTSCQKYTYGFNYGDFLAKNIVLSIFSSEFDLYHKEEFIRHIKINLLGRQSILNIMPSIIMCYLNDIPLEFLSSVKSVSNRLSIRKIENYYILDDGYNSNLLGAKYALEVLRNHAGKKFIITPGFVEMNKEKEKLILEFSNQINLSVDICILVKNDFTKMLSSYLSDNIEVFFVRNFSEGFKVFLSKKTDNSILLIENDLPDAY